MTLLITGAGITLILLKALSLYLGHLEETEDAWDGEQ